MSRLDARMQIFADRLTDALGLKKGTLIKDKDIQKIATATMGQQITINNKTIAIAPVMIFQANKIMEWNKEHKFTK
ncbi:MAG: hypothetical protein WC415_04110 [Patescibacteria group bacterium]|jgi:hypothetical protein